MMSTFWYDLHMTYILYDKIGLRKLYRAYVLYNI